MYDLLIKNAKLIDGTGSPWYRGDLAVYAGRIAAIGRIFGDARETLDAEGLCLAPGFIDIHSHSDFSILACPLSESRILQGVTTELGGNCGISPAPLDPAHLSLLRRYAGFLGTELPYDWQSVGEYLLRIEKQGTSTNYAQLIGQGAVRIAVMGFDARPAEDAELDKMCALVKEGMQEGAFGLSTGLIYPPGCFTPTPELVALNRAMAPYGGFYETHLRNEDDRLLESLQEALDIGRLADVPVEIAHHKVGGRKNWRYKLQATAALIERSRREGLDVTADVYPYAASATTMTSLLPQWALAGGVDAALERLSDPATREKLRLEVLATLAAKAALWSDYLVSSVQSEKNAWMMGHTVAEIAQTLGKEPVDAAFDLLLEEHGNVGRISFMMCEEDVEYILRQDFVTIGSDGGGMMLADPSSPHPRYFGTFPRVLGHYRRERGLFSLETAVRKMTGQSAARIGLSDRGLLKQGLWADLVLFDENEIADTPTYTAPKQACNGIRAVWVNGTLTAQNGRHTGAKAGQVLRKLPLF